MSKKAIIYRTMGYQIQYKLTEMKTSKARTEEIGVRLSNARRVNEWMEKLKTKYFSSKNYLEKTADKNTHKMSIKLVFIITTSHYLARG